MDEVNNLLADEQSLRPISASAPTNLEQAELSSEQKKQLASIQELSSVVDFLAKTQLTLNEASHSLVQSISVKISCLKEEIEVLVADCKFSLENQYKLQSSSVLDSSTDMQSNDTHYETDDEIEDPHEHKWKSKTNKDNTADFDDTDDEDTDEEQLSNAINKPAIRSLGQRLTVNLAASTDPVKYAPPRNPPLQGTINLIGVAIKWSTGSSASVSSVAKMCKEIAAASTVLTNGRLQVNTVAKVARVNLPKSRNVGEAEKRAKAMFPGYDKYAFVNYGASKVSHSSSQNMSLINTLATTAKHEFYHFAKKGYGLAHAGRYVKDGKGYKFESSRDGYSFMSIYSAPYVAGPQLYYLGMPENKVAQYDIGSPTIVYNMQLLYSKDKEGYVKGVLIPNPIGGRSMFISIDMRENANRLLLHYFTGGSSQRLAVFNKQTEFYGLNGEINPGIQIERLEYSGDLSKVRVSSKLRA